MTARTGEKLGWTAGWLGGFLWVDVLATIFLVRQQWLAGTIGLTLTAAALVTVLLCAPWRHPTTRYRRLMIPLYLLFFASTTWAIWSFGGLRASGLTWWNLALILPVLTPLGSIGGRRWCDGEASPTAPTAAGAPIDDVPCRS